MKYEKASLKGIRVDKAVDGSAILSKQKSSE
jgi:hypothetical protein